MIKVIIANDNDIIFYNSLSNILLQNELNIERNCNLFMKFLFKK